MPRYIKRVTKDPGEVLDYPGNWAPWLDGGTITAAVSTPPTGITVVSTTFTGTTTKTRVSGGVDGNDYLVPIHVTKSDGQQGERSILVQVRQR